VLALSFDGSGVGLQSLDGGTYKLKSPSGNKTAEVGARGATLAVKQGEASWALHLGPQDRLHRVLTFTLRKAAAQ
jgi:hypothetical protein